MFNWDEMAAMAMAVDHLLAEEGAALLALHPKKENPAWNVAARANTQALVLIEALSKELQMRAQASRAAMVN